MKSMAALSTIGVGIALVASLVASPPVAASDHDEDIKKDLFAVITLQGGPCGKVVSFQRLGENDYLADCQTGDRYRVNVTPEGRVAVGKHQSGQAPTERPTSDVHR